MQRSNASVTELEAEVYETGAAFENCIGGLVGLGVRDVYTMPVASAVSGRGMLLRVICDERMADDAAGYILKNTAAGSVRRRGCAAYELDREQQEIKTSLGTIRVTKLDGFGIKKIVPFEADISAAAKKEDISYTEAYNRISREINI